MILLESVLLPANQPDFGKRIDLEMLLRTFALERTQAKVWLERAVHEGRAQKLKRPVRFQSIPPADAQKGLFETSRAARNN